MRRRLSILILILAVTGLTAWANPDDDSRIARISYVEGHVSFQHPNEVDWSAASINMPLQPQDRLYTGDNGRVEIQFDDGSVLRLAEKTDVEILALGEDLIQVRVLTGLCTLTVQSSTGFEINTPAAAFNTLKKGIYRIDVTDTGDTDGIVRKGRMDAANGTFSRRIDSGELVHVTPGDNGTNLLSHYDSRDTWDDWTDRRDADLITYDSRRYLPDNVYAGARELDQYGRWVVVDSYGPAWVPNYAGAGWSPYWEGRWCYRPYWGWTWVSYEPWGWLPYHYGRWYHHAGFGWCWLPGPSYGFHFWSPGLVRFYQGPSWVSWCPLGPGDYYNVNQYRYRSTYNYQINNIRLIQNRAPDDLVNRNVPGAFRTVGTNLFASGSLGGRPVPAERVEQPWRQGRMITERLDISPNPRSFQPAPERPAVRPTNVNNLPAVVRTLPSSATSDRNAFTRIGAPPSTGARNAPGEVTGSGRNAGGRPSVDSGADARRGGVTPSVPGVPDRRAYPGNPEGPSAGRGNQANPARAYPVTGPAQGRSNAGDNQNNGSTRGRSVQPSPSVNENQRSRMPETPRSASPPSSPPERRMPSPPPQAPRNERPAPPPKSEPDKSRPHSSASADFSSTYTQGSTVRQYEAQPGYANSPAPRVGRWQDSSNARPAAPPSSSFSRGGFGGARPAPAFNAPSASGSRGGRGVERSPSSSNRGSGGAASSRHR